MDYPINLSLNSNEKMQSQMYYNEKRKQVKVR